MRVGGRALPTRPRQDVFARRRKGAGEDRAAAVRLRIHGLAGDDDRGALLCDSDPTGRGPRSLGRASQPAGAAHPMSPVSGEHIAAPRWWAEIGAAILVLFLGSAWEVTIVQDVMTNVFCAAAGLGAFLALERGDRRGDVAACLLLVAAIACWTLGVAFAIGAVVIVLLQPRD